ncbi:MAG TPA: FeoA family protein [Halanaerobiales bacterium]|nr:FeoA family protein [Halanaerobiales bacterium]
MQHFSLNQLRIGEKGEIIELMGGYGVKKRLNALGIREGKEVTKISSSFLKGPVTIQAGQSRIAIGYGMAEKILIKKVDKQ